jgi:hypothetical protein
MNSYAEVNPRYNSGNNNSNCDYTNTISSYALHSVNMQNTPVSILFFSAENINRIQRKIRSSIYNLSNGKFKLDVEQDQQDLILVMRAVYLDYGKNLDSHVVAQVKLLNQKLLETIMPDIMTNVKQAYGYLQDISQPLKPIVRPLNVSNAGRKTLPSMTTVWGF